jgi:uncharacterized YccA/Bax inhibitor family protein
MRFRGQNPVYKYGNYESTYDDTNSATYGGVVTKSTYLLGLVAVIAMYFAYTLDFVNTGITANIIVTIIIAPIIAIIAIIVTHRMPQIAIFTTTIYALAEGIFIGFISALFASFYGGEIIQMALIGTFGVLGGMLFLYASGVIRVGAFFRKLMFSMLMGIVFSSLILLILMFTGVSFESFYSLYVGIVIISVIVSSLYLLIDFDNITRYVQAGAPREAEWSLALGLVVTIIWLYIELLRLLAIIADRRS